MYFIYNGIKSYDVGVLQVYRSGESYTRPVMGNVNANYTNRPGRLTPLFYSVDRDRIVFEITLLFINRKGLPVLPNEQQRREVFNWLDTGEFNELWFSEHPDSIFYGMCTSIGDIEYYNNGALVDIVIETNSPYGWTRRGVEEVFVEGEKDIEFMVDSTITNSKHQPRIEVTALESGDVEITNYTNRGKTSKLKGMRKDETIVIDSYDRHIYSSLRQENALIKFNREWPEFKTGINNLNIKGNCIITIISQFPVNV